MDGDQRYWIVAVSPPAGTGLRGPGAGDLPRPQLPRDPPGRPDPVRRTRPTGAVSSGLMKPDAGCAGCLKTFSDRRRAAKGDKAHNEGPTHAGFPRVARDRFGGCRRLGDDQQRPRRARRRRVQQPRRRRSTPTAEVMTLNAGGPNGSTAVAIETTNDDGQERLQPDRPHRTGGLGGLVEHGRRYRRTGLGDLRSMLRRLSDAHGDPRGRRVGDHFADPDVQRHGRHVQPGAGDLHRQRDADDSSEHASDRERHRRRPRARRTSSGPCRAPAAR